MADSGGVGGGSGVRRLVVGKLSGLMDLHAINVNYRHRQRMLYYYYYYYYY